MNLRKRSFLCLGLLGCLLSFGIYSSGYASDCEEILEGRHPLDSQLLEDLANFPDQNMAREAYTYELFRRAGVPPSHIQTQSVEARQGKFHNIFVLKPGRGNRTLIISAHHDVVGTGSKGIIDNAAAIFALRDLYLDLKDVEMRHNFIFAIFALEEIGHPAGSEKYVKGLTEAQLSGIDAMLALECLAMDGNGTWDDAPEHLLQLFHRVARRLKIRLKNWPAPGYYGPYNDSRPFINRGVPAISFFGLSSQRTANQILHSRNDNMSAFSLSQYKENYRFLKEVVMKLDLLGTE